MKVKGILFNLLAPIFSGLGFGLAVVPVFEARQIWFTLIWAFITLIGLLIYVIRSIYWETKYEELRKEKNGRTKIQKKV